MSTPVVTTGPDRSTHAEVPNLSESEIAQMPTDELWEAYHKTKSEELKWALVIRYEGLIKSAAMQIRGVYSSFAQVDDIVSEGIFSLLNAVEKFDPSRGAKFETYISKRIRGMVIDLARKQDWLPRNIRRRSKEIDQAISLLSTELGRSPTDAEVADMLGITPNQYHKDMASVALSNILSLDALVDAKDRDGSQFEMPSSDLHDQPEAALQDRELQQTLADGIKSLRENEQIVLSLYYEKNLHMKEISQVLEVSEPRVSQIHARAIQKLRAYMEAYLSGAPVQLKKRKKGKHV